MAETRIYTPEWSALLGRFAVPPAAPIHLAADDILRLSVDAERDSMSFILSGYVLNPAGDLVPFSITTDTVNTGFPASADILLGECTLLSCVVQKYSGICLRGDAYARLHVVRGSGAAATLLYVLLEGYVTTAHFLAYPTSPLEARTGGQGALAVMTGVAPAAGAEISTSLPGYQRWRLMGWKATLITAASAATRQVHLQITSGSTVLMDFPAAATEIISLTRTYFGAAYGYAPGLVAADIYIPIAPDLVLNPYWTVNTLTDNIAAGDQWNAPVLTVESWEDY